MAAFLPWAMPPPVLLLTRPLQPTGWWWPRVWWTCVPACVNRVSPSLVRSDGRILAMGDAPAGFAADQTIAAHGLVVAPGLVDLCARLRESGQPKPGQLSSERAAAAAGGVTTLVCPPDTAPVLDEAGLVDMLHYRTQIQGGPRVLPLGALTP